MHDSLSLFLRRVLFMIRKELITTLRDPKSQIILILPVLVQGFLYGYVANYNLDEAPYAVLDQSRSKYSVELVSKFDGSGLFKRARTLSNATQIADCIDSGDTVMVLTIGPEFAKQIASGQSAPIQVITDGRNTMTSGVVAGYASAIVANYNSELQNNQNLIDVKSITWYNPNQLTHWGFLASLLPMMSLSQIMMLAGLSVAREREDGTFEQLLVTPLGPIEILIGKAVPPILIGLAQCTLVLMLSVFWFKVKFVGSLATLYLTLLIFLISCVGIGLSISAISSSMQQVMVYNFVVLMPIMLLSGMSTPVRNMPEVLQYITYINPLRFAIEAVRRIYLEGATLGIIAPDFIPMVIVAAVTMPTAGWLFRHKLS